MSSSPKTTAKADVLKDMATSTTIEADVDSAAKNFEELQANLDSLLSSLKAQHDAILALNEKSLKAASDFEVFVTNSPIKKVAGVFNIEEAKVPLFQVDHTDPGLKEEEDNESEAGETLETAEETLQTEPHSDHSGEKAATDEEASSKGDDEGKDATVAPSSGTSVTTHGEFKIFAPLKTAPPEFFNVENSFAAARQQSYKLTKMYADQYEKQIIVYVEKWQKITKDRVSSRLMEFEDHREKLKHYRSKVEKLQEAAEKKADHHKSLSKGQSEKLDRNKLKLNGAREAHDTYGESLYLLIEEVNERAWRDILPVLLKTLEFDYSYSKDEAKVYSKNVKTIAALKAIAEENGVSADGRLQQLKTNKSEVLYTGEREVVPPVVKSPAKAQ